MFTWLHGELNPVSIFLKGKNLIHPQLWYCTISKTKIRQSGGMYAYMIMLQIIFTLINIVVYVIYLPEIILVISLSFFCGFISLIIFLYLYVWSLTCISEVFYENRWKSLMTLQKTWIIANEMTLGIRMPMTVQRLGQGGKSKQTVWPITKW